MLLLGLVPSGFTACGHLGVGLVTTATTRTVSYFLVGSGGIEGGAVEDGGVQSAVVSDRGGRRRGVRRRGAKRRDAGVECG